MKYAPPACAALVLAPAIALLPLAAQTTPSPTANFMAQDDTGWLPPDTHGAAGPNHVVTAVNGGVRIQDRSGTVIRSTALNTFLNRTDTVFDPKVYYDHFSERWLLAACANGGSPDSAVIIAGSKTSDPSGSWWVYSFDADASNAVWADYPSVGFNKNWFVVGMNMFQIGGGYSTGRLYVLPRETIYSGASITPTLFNDSDGFTMTPAVTHDATLETEYVLHRWNGSSGGRGYLRLLRITGSVNAPQLTEVGRPSTTLTWRNNSGMPGNILPQSGGVAVNGLDDRIQNVVYRNGSLWATHNGYAVSGSTLRSFVQWWEISPQAQTLQHARIEDAGGTIQYCFPSIAVNRSNDVLVGFSQFSPSTHPGAAYAFRGSGDAAGTMRAPLVYKAGEASYQKNDTAGRNRWGDYSATVTDPVDDTSFWTIQEYSIPGNRWATRWARIDLGGGATSTLRFTQNNYPTSEGAGTATITVTRTGNLRSSVSVNYATGNGSAIAGSDYTSTADTLNFGDGEDTKTFDVSITDDSDPNEPDETVNLTLSMPSAGATLGSPSTATLTISDNDVALPVVTVAATDNSASEPSDPGVFTLTRSGSTAVALDVGYGMSGSAGNGTDYQSLSGSVTIPAGSPTTTVTLNPIDDTGVESTETAIFTVNTGAGYSIGSPSNATVNLLDNDQTPVVTIQAGDATANEDGNGGSFIITRTGGTTGALPVNLSAGGTATAGADYTTLPASVNIPAGSASATVDVTPLDDSLVEGSESVVLSIGPGGGYVVGSPQSATVTIGDNDVAIGNDAFAGRLPFTNLNVNGSNTTATKEGGEPNHAGNTGGRSVWWTWTATFTGSVTFSTTGSSFDTLLAVYTGSSLGTLAEVASDDDSGGNRTSSATFSAVLGTVYQVAVDGYNGASGDLTLSRTADPVQLATVTIAASDADATEGSSDNGTFTITRTGSTGAALSVSLSVGGTATNNVDYAEMAPSFTLPAGASSGTITIDTLDDSQVEGDETVIVSLQSGTGYDVGTPAAATVTIADNDSTVGNDLFGNAAVMSGAVELGTNVGATSESGEPGHAGSPASASVWWRWTASFSGSVTFHTNGSGFDTVLAVYTGTSVNALTPVASDDDSGNGNASLLNFTATAGVTYHVAVDGSGGATGSITLTRSGDPLPKPLVTTRASDSTAKEGSGDVGRFVITRSGSTAAGLSVNVSFGGTATNGADYDALSTPQVIPAGFSSLEITVSPVDDGEVEGDETAILTIEPGAEYDVEPDAVPYIPGGRATATVTITDNDVSTSNDAFADRFALSGSSFSTTGGNSAFSKESGEPSHAGNEGGKSAWWSWTAPVSGSFTFSTSGSSFDTLLAVYTGSSVSTLVAVASNDDGLIDLTSEVTFTATAGTVYHIAVDGYSYGSSSAAGGLINLSGASGGGVLLPPVITGPTAALGAVGLSFSYTITGTSSPTSFGATGLPAGLSVNTSTGVISGMPTTTGEFLVTLSATNAAGTGIGSLDLTVLETAGQILYQTDFESFVAGDETVIGDDGWVGETSAHGIVVDFFPNRGQQMYVGSDTLFAGEAAFYWRPLNYDPLSNGTPLIRVTAELAFVDSTNGLRDDFGFLFYNKDGDYLAGILFENSTGKIWIGDGSDGPFIDSGQTFNQGEFTHLEIEVDYSANSWTASRHGVQLFAPRPFHLGGDPLTLGDVSLYWSIRNLFPGDNYMLVDNLSITAETGGTSSFSSSGAVTIPSSGAASPYPSVINVSGLAGALERVTVRLDGLVHTWGDDLDILLVAPDGSGVVLMSDTGGGESYAGHSLIFDDLAPTGLLDANLATHSGRYRPTDFEPGDSFPASAPAGPYLASLSSLHGIDPNGQWQLFVVDDDAGATGSLAAWTLELGAATVSENYATWRARFFSAAEITAGLGDQDEDPDGDGLDNLMEYALGMHPRLVDLDSPKVPRATVENQGGVQCLCFQYPRDLSRSGITYIVQTSLDGINWSAFTGQDELVNQVGTVETRKAYLPMVNQSGLIRLAVVGN